jgi:hypothetical protein
MERADLDRLSLARSLPATFAQARFQMNRIAAFLAQDPISLQTAAMDARDAA